MRPTRVLAYLVREAPQPPVALCRRRSPGSGGTGHGNDHRDCRPQRAVLSARCEVRRSPCITGGRHNARELAALSRPLDARCRRSAARVLGRAAGSSSPAVPRCLGTYRGSSSRNACDVRAGTGRGGRRGSKRTVGAASRLPRPLWSACRWRRSALLGNGIYAFRSISADGGCVRRTAAGWTAHIVEDQCGVTDQIGLRE